MLVFLIISLVALPITGVFIREFIIYNAYQICSSSSFNDVHPHLFDGSVSEQPYLWLWPPDGNNLPEDVAIAPTLQLFHSSSSGCPDVYNHCHHPLFFVCLLLLFLFCFVCLFVFVVCALTTVTYSERLNWSLNRRRGRKPTGLRLRCACWFVVAHPPSF